MRVHPVVNINVNRGSIRVTRRNEGVLPPQSVPVSVSACGGVEAYNEGSFHVRYRSRGVHTSFYESAPSASDSLGNTIPPGDTHDPGNARADFPNASEERKLRNISRHSRVLFEHIPGTQGIWRVASSYRLKTTEPPHQRSSHSHAHYKLSAEYRRKRRLHVQNRSAGLNTAPQVFTRLGHTVPAYLHHQGISVIPYLDDWLIHHPDCQVLLCHQSQLLNILNMIGLTLNEANSELEPVQDIQFLGLQLLLNQGRASLPVSKAREIMAHHFLGCLDPELGHSHGGFSDCGCMDPF